MCQVECLQVMVVLLVCVEQNECVVGGGGGKSPKTWRISTRWD